MATWSPIPWHGTSTDRVLLAVRSSRSGLGTVEALRRHRVFGANVLPRGQRTPLSTTLLRQFQSPLQLLLLGSGVLALVFGRPFDGAVVVAVVVLNATIGAVQELRAARAVESLDALVPDFATVLRDGLVASAPAAELVPGDVVMLQAGDRVAADMRVLSARNLQAAESTLTGESSPAAKSEAAVATAAPLGDRSSMTFAGTTIVTGTGRAVVVAIAARTELGRIAGLLQQTRDIETPLTRALKQFGRSLTQAICLVVFFVFRAAHFRGYPVFDAVRSAVSIAVAAVPSGLPAVITVALAVTVRRMARRNAIVRTMPSVETLGTTTVICSDKTGTLTRGEMTVRGLYTGSSTYELTGVGYVARGELRLGTAPLREVPANVLELLLAGVLCNDATLRGTRCTGDPTEIAFVVAAEKLALAVEAARALWPRLDEIPFDPAQRYMATLHRGPDGRPLIAVKGAPEVLVRLCDRDADGRALDVARVLAAAEAFACRGMRVLAIGALEPDGDVRALVAGRLEGMRLLGLAGMIDPPRIDAVEAVHAARRAGIAVKMVTGDHPTTAKAIGIEIGIATPASQVVTGEQIERMGPARLKRIARRTNVWARVEPEQKLRLVQALQANREVVAATGDGVNDAPALKQADVGVAMGKTGTAVAKESADIVLVDDNFASIPAAIAEGRRCYDNLVRAITFAVPTNLGQAVAVLLAVLTFPVLDGVPLLPIQPLQILWVNLVTGVTLAAPLTLEPAERDVMLRPPRVRDEPIFTKELGVRCLVVGALMAAGAIGLFLYVYYGPPAAFAPPDLALRRAQTMATTTLVLFQVFYLFQCRASRETLQSDRGVYAGVALTLLLQVAFAQTRTMNATFHTAPLAASDWLLSAAVAMTVLPAVALQKSLQIAHARALQRPTAATRFSRVGGRRQRRRSMKP